MKHIKRFSFVLAIICMFLGMAGLKPASAAEGDFHFTVVTAAYDYDAAQFSLEDHGITKVNGADQVSWEAENATGTISGKRIKAAPRIHTRCTSSNRLTQSQQIWRMTHSTIVIILPGSCLWNRGKHDNIMMGFPMNVNTPVILIGDSHHRYRHGFSLVRNTSQVAAGEHVIGKVKVMSKVWLIVVKCRNFIGGPVNVYVPSVVQVHYASDIQRSGTAVAKTGVHTDVEFGVTCPNGAYFKVNSGGFAYGYASTSISFTERTRASVLVGKTPGLTIDSQVNGQASAVSAAQLSLDVSGNCGSNPPPPAPTMTLSLDRPNDLDQSIAAPGQPIDWSYTPTMGHSVAPDGAGNVTYTVQAVYGSVKFITPDSPCDTNGLRNNVVTTLTEPSGTYDIALCYIASTEDPASYGGTDTITLTSVFAGKTYQASQPITINPTPVIPG
jgi:hypothetical protein